MAQEKEKDEVYEPITEEEDARLADDGIPVEVEPTPLDATLSLFTLRLLNDTIRALEDVGRLEHKSPRVLAREILEEGVKERGMAMPEILEAIRAGRFINGFIKKVMAEGFTPSAINTRFLPSTMVFEPVQQMTTTESSSKDNLDLSEKR